LALASFSSVCSAEQLLIKAAKIYTMTGEPLKPGAVLITDGKISQVGQSLDVPEGATVKDLGEGILIPGLVDAHGDADVVIGSSELTREVTPDFRVLSAIHWDSRGFREALAEGTTTIHVTPGADNVFSGLSSAVKTAGTRGERMVNAETGLVLTMSSDPSERNRSRTRPDSIYVRQPTNRMGVVWILRSTFDQVAKKAGSQATDAKSSPSKGTEVAEKQPEKQNSAAARSAAARALSGELRVLGLGRTHFEILSLLNLAKEFGLTVTVLGGTEAYKVADQLAEKKTPVILGRLTSGALVGPDGSDLFWNGPGALHKAGVTFAISGGRLLEQAQFAVRFGLPADAALQAITTTPAKLLGLDDRVGSVAPGKDADLVALRGEPLEFSSGIRWVMVNGKIYNEEQ
jgi:imidazolonepropionase-like amidohydrolase